MNKKESYVIAIRQIDNPIVEGCPSAVSVFIVSIAHPDPRAVPIEVPFTDLQDAVAFISKIEEDGLASFVSTSEKVDD